MGSFPGWLTAFLILTPIGWQVVPRVVPADVFLLWGLIMAVGLAITTGRIRLMPADLAFIAFFGFSLLGTDITRFPSSFVFEAAAVVFLYLGSRMLGSLLPGGGRLIRGVRALNSLFVPMLGVLAVAVVFRAAGIEVFSSFFSTAERLRGPFEFSNQLGIFLLGAMPLAFGMRQDSPARRILLFLGFFTVLGAVGSRAALVLGFLEAVALESTLPAGREREIPLWIRLGALTCLVLVLGLAFSQEFAFRRAMGAETVAPLTFDTDRQDNFRHAVNALEFCLTGVGLGCFSPTGPFEIHNTPLSVLVETGLGGAVSLGLVFFLLLHPLAGLLRSKKAALRRLGRCLIVSLSGLFLMSLAANLLRTRILWILLGLTQAARCVPADGGVPVLSGQGLPEQSLSGKCLPKGTVV